jgi:signal transduction histidine kinase
MVDRIFDRFVQIGTAEPRGEAGLGIGLSVVKALVELHGGTVEARSAGAGKGSEFIFRLPLQAN